MRILITGSEGFIGTNLCLRLKELREHEVVGITESSSFKDLSEAVSRTDMVFHLAGVNRPKDVQEFTQGNVNTTSELCRLLAATGRRIPVVFSSSTQANLDNPYGLSKRQAEEILLAYGAETGAAVVLFRLTNIFGKWARPNYNSAVATFCHNIARKLPITVNEPSAPLSLVHVDDVVKAFLDCLENPVVFSPWRQAGPVYETTVGEVARIIQEFADSRNSLLSPRVGTGLLRALYSTYLSYLPPANFAYQVPKHADPRGEFAEMLKTPDCGQFSYFTAHPGVTRGDHYHHTKTEKFLVIRGTANFGFRHIITGETFNYLNRGGDCCVVETMPGWTHNITNIGEDELIVMLWANEIFDPKCPDTFPQKVTP
jgi:UDP-2-acetamido-2,6-beta-L-arabino-hexul-4-ose reductase